MSDIKNFMGWDAPGVALVTGASSGIGAEFARQLAAQGFNTILVARRKERLDDLASSLTNDFSGEHEVLVADLSTDAGIEAVEQRIAAAGNLDVLVNNAGGGGNNANFQDTTLDSQLNMLNLQAMAPVRLAKAALPAMIDRQRGVIINVASADAFILRRGHVMYSATKAFLRTFSESLAMDLQGTHVRVQALCPGAVDTEIWKTRPGFPEEMWVPKDQLVAASLDAFKKKAVTIVVSDTTIMETAKAFLKDTLRDLEKQARKDKV